jgi:hypothetical protein
MAGILFFGTFSSLPTGYRIGFLPALGVGCAVAIWGWRSGEISYRAAIGASLAIWLVPYLAYGDLYAQDGVRLSRLRGLLPSYLASAIMCTWIVRRIL